MWCIVAIRKVRDVFFFPPFFRLFFSNFKFEDFYNLTIISTIVIIIILYNNNVVTDAAETYVALACSRRAVVRDLCLHLRSSRVIIIFVIFRAITDSNKKHNETNYWLLKNNTR